MPSRISLTLADGRPDDTRFVFEESSRCVVGRADDCDIRLPNDFAYADISRHHCVFEIDPPAIRVRDLGSRNGTFVNGERICQRPDPPQFGPSGLLLFEDHELRDGDEVSIGHLVIHVDVTVMAEKPEPVYFPVGVFW